MPRALGGTVGQLPRTTGSRILRGRIGGVCAVTSMTLIAVGFLVATVVVIALARTTTARWEKAGRWKRPLRRKVIAPGAALTGDAVRRPAPLRRGLVAAIGSLASRGARPRVVDETVVTIDEPGTSRMRLLRDRFRRPYGRLRNGGLWKRRRTTKDSPAVPVQDEPARTSLPLRSARIPGSRAARGDGVAGRVGRRFFHRIPSRPRRRAGGFLHRRAPEVSSDEARTAAPVNDVPES